jgi:hypothetical protein
MFNAIIKFYKLFNEYISSRNLYNINDDDNIEENEENEEN